MAGDRNTPDPADHSGRGSNHQSMEFCFIPASMKIPRATYRLQFHYQFTFEDAQKVVEYLSHLGISDIYASPIFKSRKDSMHGYDIVDPTQINPQLGGKDGF